MTTTLEATPTPVEAIKILVGELREAQAAVTAKKAEIASVKLALRDALKTKATKKRAPRKALGTVTRKPRKRGLPQAAPEAAAG